MNELRRSPEEIEREIIEIRAQIDHTLDAVQEKLSPGELLDQALTYVKEETGVFAGNFGRTVRDNPVPAVLLGVSLAWLAFASRSGPPAAYRADGSRPGGGDGDLAWKRDDLMHKGEALADQASGTAADVRERASAVASGVTARAAEVRHRAGDFYDHAAQRLHEAREQARARWETTRRELVHGGETAADFLKSNPLALVGLGLTAGVVAAAIIPRTAHEDALLGERRDALLDDVKEAASAAAPVVDTAKHGTEQTAQAASRAVEETVEEGHTGSQGDTTGDAPQTALPLGPHPVTT